MSAGILGLVGVVGGLGAIARFVLDRSISMRMAGTFPYGTFAVNIAGAFVLGTLVGASLHTNAYRIAGVGFLGAFTTFSTWMFESHRLAEDGELGFGLVNILISLAVGLAAAAAGRHLGTWL